MTEKEATTIKVESCYRLPLKDAVILREGGNHCYLNRYWITSANDELLFRQLGSCLFPYCNANQDIAESMLGYFEPGCKVMFVEQVIRPPAN